MHSCNVRPLTAVFLPECKAGVRFSEVDPTSGPTWHLSHLSKLCVYAHLERRYLHHRAVILYEHLGELGVCLSTVMTEEEPDFVSGRCAPVVVVEETPAQEDEKTEVDQHPKMRAHRCERKRRPTYQLCGRAARETEQGGEISTGIRQLRQPDVHEGAEAPPTADLGCMPCARDMVLVESRARWRTLVARRGYSASSEARLWLFT